MTARAELQSPSRIDSVRIELQHLAVEVLSARRRFREAVEIADVLPSLFKGAGIVAAFRSLIRSA
jgi:hypothetical protein